MVDYSLALEIANGFGFVVAITLAVTLFVFLMAQIKGRSWAVITLTIGMILVKIGLALGFGYRWLVTQCQNRGTDCEQYADDNYLLFVGVLVIAGGGMMILRVLSKPEWRPWSWLATLAVSLIVPGFYYAFDVLFPTARPVGTHVDGFYNPFLVILSVVIAVAGSYVALEIARLALAETKMRWVWLTISAIILGTSIWAMHFTAMMAYELPGVNVYFDFWLTLLSLIIPIVMTWVGLLAAAGDGRHPIVIVLSGILIGIGVVAMHYTGMAAMEMSNAVATFNLYWVFISGIVAVIGSIIAVYLVFIETTFWERIAGAVVMGTCGIAGLHYTAMIAFSCYRVT